MTFPSSALVVPSYNCEVFPKATHVSLSRYQRNRKRNKTICKRTFYKRDGKYSRHKKSEDTFAALI